MNYWLLTTEYPPFHGGGISTYCYFTARMLAERGVTVTIFTQDEKVRGEETSSEGPGITLVRFNPDRRGLSASLGYTARLSYSFADIVMTHILQEGKPDIIESQDYQGIAYYLTQFRHLGYPALRDIPILITLHSPAFVYLDYNRVPFYRFPDFWTCEMEKQSIIGADCLVSPTVFLIDEIGRYMDLSSREVSVLPNPYQPDAPASQPASAASPVPPFTRNKIVYYGKLSPQKGTFELLQYFKELWDDGFEHPLHMVGGTDIVFHPERRTMGQLVEKKYGPYLQKGLLQLHGKIRPAELADRLNNAHLIIIPSIVDNLPYVVMEAMSLGKVVLVSRQGGQREMVEQGVSGFIFDHDKTGSFRRELEAILALSDQDILEIGSRARQHVQQLYSFQVVGDAKIALLQKIRLLPPTKFPFLFQEPFDPSCLSSSSWQPDGRNAELPPDGLLTVVIPHYNLGKYLEGCILSIQASTYKPLEILIIDDGSTDKDSLSLLRKVGQFPNTRVVFQSNQGLAAARNAGARMARGEFLAFLDADDLVRPAYFEKAITALQKNENVFFVGAWTQYFENSRALWATYTPQPPYALIHNPVNSSSLVYKRQAFLAGGLNDPQVGYGLEDYESVINMLHHGFNGVVIPEPLFEYRVRTGSMIRGLTLEKQLYSYKYISKKHDQYYTKFASPVFNLLNANGPGYSFDNPSDHAPLMKGKLFHQGARLIRKIAAKNPRVKRLILAFLPLKK
jgi:glycosyltransferase involved in cell wall biosynthesis